MKALAQGHTVAIQPLTIRSEPTHFLVPFSQKTTV